jgi:hypothetical protein
VYSATSLDWSLAVIVRSRDLSSGGAVPAISNVLLPNDNHDGRSAVADGMSLSPACESSAKSFCFSPVMCITSPLATLTVSPNSHVWLLTTMVNGNEESANPGTSYAMSYICNDCA